MIIVIYVVVKKKRERSLKKYGTEYHIHSNAVKEKIKQTNLKKYGVENISQSEEIKNKIKKNNLEKYGVEHTLQTNEVKNKSKQTNLKKYGVEYPSQNKEILEKQIKSSFTQKEFRFPKRNQIVKVQGYEPQCLNDLLQNESINEEDLLEGYRNRPTIQYEYNGKKHYYHPDIYIPSKNMIIEVKSQYTFDKETEINLLKIEATKQAGYEAEIRIYNHKGICEKKY